MPRIGLIIAYAVSSANDKQRERKVNISSLNVIRLCNRQITSSLWQYYLNSLKVRMSLTSSTGNWSHL